MPHCAIFHLGLRSLFAKELIQDWAKSPTCTCISSKTFCSFYLVELEGSIIYLDLKLSKQ